MGPCDRAKLAACQRPCSNQRLDTPLSLSCHPAARHAEAELSAAHAELQRLQRLVESFQQAFTAAMFGGFAPQ